MWGFAILFAAAGIFPAAHTPEQRALRYSSRGRPGIDRDLHKWRDGHGAYPLSLAHQVDEHPAAVALLDMRALERRELVAAQSAAQKHRENRTVALSFGGLYLGLSEQVARLFTGSQFPALVPAWLTPLGDTIPWATLRSSKSFSAASAASLRIADSRRLTEADARPAESRTLRYC